MKTAAWVLLLAALLATRLPAFVEPAGNDQSLYAYAGSRLLAGDVPYRDVWDQKPPGIMAAYAVLWLVDPHESVVALGDLIAAGVTAALLVVLGTRLFGPSAGIAAAAVFLLFGHPAISKNSGVYVRGQCEVFIAAAVTGALVALAARRRRQWHLVTAGALLGVAFWLKYNALAYGLPAAVLAVWRPGDRRAAPSTAVRDLLVLGATFAVVVGAVFAWFAAHGALADLRLATVDYNLQYSAETYTGRLAMALYPLWLPLQHARVDMLWFLGGLGAVLMLARMRAQVGHWATLAWIAAALASISANGARGLPQYFVQAAPAMAIAAGAGWMAVITSGRWVRSLTAVAIAAGLWRVGVEAEFPRLGGLPQLAANVAFDVDYWRGRIDRETFLRRFKGEQKYDALEIDRLATLVRTTTRPDDRILVFGFSPGVYVTSGRASASRFHWSRPLVVNFAANEPGYGAAGLLGELERTRPALVALQKKDWGIDPGTAAQSPIGEPHSRDYFMNNAALSSWLTTSYVQEQETPIFTVWRRKS